MMASWSSLPISVKDLLCVQGSEGERVEFKKAWHNMKESGSRGTNWQVLHTICAFANDFGGVNGGYIVIGVEENLKSNAGDDDREIILPPVGVKAREIDRIQKEIMGACRANINPEYTPIIASEVVEINGVRRNLVVIWAMASEGKRHTCKENDKGGHFFYVRRGRETRKATHYEQRQLLMYSEIPFDDRRAVDYENCRQPLSEGCIHANLVHRFLRGVNSKLQKKVEEGRPDIYFYKKLRLVKEVGDKKIESKIVPLFVPKNVALLLFHPRPHEFFPGAKIEIAMFTSSNHIDEKKLVTGPIDQQISQTLCIIKKNTLDHAYPAKAIQEAVVNAILHRSYENSASNPVKIMIKPSGIDIVSYPGPNCDLKIEHFSQQCKVPNVPIRNQRLAEFLLKLDLIEGFGTGIETIFEVMKENGNPEPSFEFGSNYFKVHLPSCTECTTSPTEQDKDNKDNNSGDGDDEKGSNDDVEEGRGNGDYDQEGDDNEDNGANFQLVPLSEAHGNHRGDVEHNAGIQQDLKPRNDVKHSIQESCGFFEDLLLGQAL